MISAQLQTDAMKDSKVDAKEPSLNSMMEFPKMQPGYLSAHALRFKKHNSPPGGSSNTSVSRRSNTSPSSIVKFPNAIGIQSPIAQSRSEQLNIIMEDDPSRRRFRRFLVGFWLLKE